MPEVSVIIPNYNHAPYLRKRIENVLNQTYQNFELILMDDHSTDDSKSIIESYRTHPKISAILYNESNSGSTFKQWNKGVQKARYEYIWIAESDDLASDNFLEILSDILNTNPKLGLVYAKSVCINEEDEVIDDLSGWYELWDKTRWENDYYNDGRAELENYLIYRDTIPNASGVLFKKNIFLSAGMAPEDYKLCGDWLTWMRMLNISDVAFTVKAENFFRRHDKTVRRSKNILITQIRERYKMIKTLKKQGVLTAHDSAIMLSEVNRIVKSEGLFLARSSMSKIRSSLLDAILVCKLLFTKIIYK